MPYVDTIVKRISKYVPSMHSYSPPSWEVSRIEVNRDLHEEVEDIESVEEQGKAEKTGSDKNDKTRPRRLVKKLQPEETPTETPPQEEPSCEETTVVEEETTNEENNQE